MKRTLSLLLTLLLLFSAALPAFAGGEETFEEAFLFDGKAQNENADTQRPMLHREGNVPLINVSGDGNNIYDSEGNKLYAFPEALVSLLSGEGGAEDFDLKESFQTVLRAYIKGALTFQEDKFYDALQTEVAKLTEKIQMDENGDPKFDTDVSRECYERNDAQMTTPNQNGVYNMESYHFWYDWRRSPLEIADRLDAYIEAVCEMTGQAQVALSGRCLGTNFVMAYLAKFGYKNRIRGLSLDVGMMHGQNALSEALSGKFSSDGEAILRYLTDVEFELDDWVIDLIEFMEASGIFKNMNASIKAPIYARVARGVTSALALSTLATMPGYWSCVALKDYDDALLYVFGKEGSEKRKTYAGLIQKIKAYHDEVQVGMDEMLQRFAADGGKIAVIVKYGFQLMPMCDSRNELADTFVSVHNASLGATTSLLYQTLDDSYIAARQASGLGKYISPDRQIDASTCLFPDSTWFLKGVEHNFWTITENAIAYTVATGEVQYTVNDFDRTQFLVRNSEEELVPMTAENCHVEQWQARDPASLSFKERLNRFFLALRRVLGDFFVFLGERMKAES